MLLRMFPTMKPYARKLTSRAPELQRHDGSDAAVDPSGGPPLRRLRPKAPQSSSSLTPPAKLLRMFPKRTMKPYARKLDSGPGPPSVPSEGDAPYAEILPNTPALNMHLVKSHRVKADDIFLKDAMEAGAWCQLQTFTNHVSLPMVIGMEGAEQQALLAELKSVDRSCPEESPIRIEPFQFFFNSQKDYEMFCVEMFDRRKLKVFASWE
ncbi:unnamed protein product [Boreogadus saida]